jgi:hypothetical protein
MEIVGVKVKIQDIQLIRRLRLYRAPKESQLLERLGGAWHTPSPHQEKITWLSKLHNVI